MEVADPKDEVGEGEARKTEGKDELKLEGLQCRGWGLTREQSEDCSLQFAGLIY